jgi:hypothetical protein
MTPGQGQGPDRPLDHLKAETCLRMLAEAELRRVEALPRPDPLAEMGVPAPLRGAVRLGMPLGQRAVTALRPLSENAAQTLRPLTDGAAQTLGPLAENVAQTLRPVAGTAARSLQPLAESAARAIQPLTGRLVSTALPAAERAARTLHPLARQAAGRLLELRFSGAHQLRMWRSRATAPLARVTGRHPPRHEERSPENGLRRILTMAHALSWVGALDSGTADSVVAGLETALAARSRIPPHRLRLWLRHAMLQQHPGRPPAGTYLAAPLGVLVPTAPESGLGDICVITMVIAPDRAVLTAAGRMARPDDRSLHRDPWPVFSQASRPAAIDDRGNRYELHEDAGRSEPDGEWDVTLRIAPIPPAGIQWLELTMSPGSAPIRVDLAGANGGKAASPETAGSPAERLIDFAAMKLLNPSTDAAAESPPTHDLSQVADVVTALDAVGALAPARDAVGRLVTLADRLGVDVPPALSDAGPPRPLPAAWVSVLENSGREDGPRGVAPVAAVLPELDGTRFVLAGLRSHAAGAELDVLAWGDHRMSGVPWRGRDAWSWSARDDQGRWHILTADSFSASDMHAQLKLNLKPPLHPDATSLEVHVAGRSGEATATVPLDWRECP